jgi:hypothetical protein
MIISVHQPQYLPWLGFFEKVARSDAFVFLDCVQYKEREYQNRNRIRTQTGPLWLSVPVVSRHKGRQKICDVVIDNEKPWARQHLKSLESWYAKTAFFDEYIPFFRETYARRWEQLMDLNIHIIRFMLKQLGIGTPLRDESALCIATLKTDRIIDICRKLKADTYLSGAGGRQYLEEGKFKEAGITLCYQEFRHPVYHQQFMKDASDFLPYMSAVDLLFNEGPNSRNIVGLA